MKKQVVKELEKLINGFNEKNAKFKFEIKPYELSKPFQFKRGNYSIYIKYDFMPSTDFSDLMEFVKSNNVTIWLSMSNITNIPRIEMQ